MAKKDSKYCLTQVGSGYWKNFSIPSAHHVVRESHRDCKNKLYKFRPPEDLINSVSPSILEKPTIEYVQESAGSIERSYVQESGRSMERPATESVKKLASETSNDGTNHPPSSTAKLALSLWHQRLGHANLQTLHYCGNPLFVFGRN